MSTARHHAPLSNIRIQLFADLLLFFSPFSLHLKDAPFVVAVYLWMWSSGQTRFIPSYSPGLQQCCICVSGFSRPAGIM